MSVHRFDEYAELRRTDPVSSYGLERRTQAVLRLIRAAGTGPRFRLLDLGTADGAMLTRLREGFPRAGFGGVEYNASLCATAAALGAPVVRGDARTLPFPDGGTDLVLLSATLKHVERPEAVLAEAHRVLAPGGHLLLLDPTPFGIRVGLRFGHFDARYLPNIWSLGETVARTREAGFTVATSFRYMLSPRHFPAADSIERALIRLRLTGLFLQQALLARKPD